MKKIMKRLAAALLAAVMLVPTGAMAAATNDAGELVVRVGLASSSKHNAIGALACANLQNAEGHGAGFRFGYYDENLNFVELARTDYSVTQAAVVKTQNLCYGYDSEQGRYTYSSSLKSDIKIGCYHLQLPETFYDYEEAAAVAAQYHGGFVAWIDGALRVRIGAWFTRDEAVYAQESLGIGELAGTSSSGVSVVENGTDRILFQFDDHGTNRLAILPDVTGNEDVHTWFRGYKYRGGFTYERIGGGDMTVVNVLPLEDYIKGVAPYEMGREWPLEALKTQATCARTYVIANLNKHNDMGFDVCNSSWCQVYYGTGSSRENYGPTAVSDRAVEETAGQVIWYENKLAEAFYSSSHGGASESIENVWGSKLSKYPYLCGVVDPYEQATDSVNASSPWKVTYSRSELAGKLQSYGFGVGSNIDRLELTYSDLGNVIKLVVYWTNGQKNTFKPDDIRAYFSLNSIRFHVNDVTVRQDVEEEVKESVIPEENIFPLNQNSSVAFGSDYTQSVYVLTGSGTVTEIRETPYIITGRGSKSKLTIQREEEKKPEEQMPVSYAGTVTVSDSSYTFSGRGWGHQLGMSQYGANAMAQQGFSFDEIITFYYHGTHVSYFNE